VGEVPYELRPDTGRRGRTELWERFDEAVAQLSRAGATTDLLAVADAYDALAHAAGALADSIALEDRAAAALRPRRSA
jgi:hypothetical protein